MSYKVKTIPRFDKELKRLARKFPSLKMEFIALVDSLEKNAQQGVSLGNHCYKIRLSIASKGQGKSGGARVITCVRIIETSVYLLTIFDKADRENISDKEIRKLVIEIP
jgi:hypothetical protein